MDLSPLDKLTIAQIHNPDKIMLDNVHPTIEHDDCIDGAEPTKAILDQVESAISRQDYILAVNCASAALDQIQRRELTFYTLLDCRAYALGMQGKFDGAINDAMDIIQHQPDAACGYLRLGWIQSIQGKSSDAIDTYNIGLAHISKDSAGYNLLVNEKTISMQQSNKRIDFFAKLPAELVHSILDYLHMVHKLTCLEVSQIWRKEILECPTAWEPLTLGHGTQEEHINRILPRIACHVKTLAMDTTHILFWHQFTRNTTYFSSIRTFCLEEATSELVDNIVEAMTQTLEHFSATLTSLTLKFNQYAIPIAVEDVLSICPKLEKLSYVTPELPDALYPGEYLTDHPALIDFYLIDDLIDNERIASLLRRCHKLQRLVLGTCTPKILNVIRQHCPRLQILGYNIDEEDVPNLHEVDNSHQQCGLRAIYSRGGFSGIPMEHLFPMLAEHAQTLEMLDIDPCPSDGQSYHIFDHNFLKMSSLKSLEYCLTYNDDDIERIILQSISECKALNRFVAYSTGAISTIADTLITLPPVEELTLQGTIEYTIADASLVSLFQKYATTAHTISQQLKTVHFGSCESVTDRSLSALGQVKTLKSITLYQLNNVSSDGLQSFLEALSDTSVTQIELGPWDVITDSHLHAISRMQNLKELVLDKTPYISDIGIMDVANNCKTLRLLYLQRCNTITAAALLYAKSKNVNVTLLDTDPSLYIANSLIL